MNKKRKKYLFGPVSSRRLGVSLGIDLLPYKTCTLDCVYCECGATTNLTLCRKEYVPVHDVLEELDEFLQEGPALDYVTFAGSGEPLLHSRIGEIIAWIKLHYPHYAVAVLTNGTLLPQQEVRASLARTDLVIPSLDAVTSLLFQKINRPHISLDCHEIISGLVQFRQEYRGEIWLEIFIIPGLNNNILELEQMGEVIRQIKPDRIQLNTLDRPGAESWVQPAGENELKKCSAIIGEDEITEGFQRQRATPLNMDHQKNVLDVLQSRQCTARDLVELLGFRPVEVNKHLHMLVQAKRVGYVRKKHGLFYEIKNNDSHVPDKGNKKADLVR